ncbi:hypothetical protein [Actomonas aquatica]|uniref:Uncharacterized protein n=1 Tax=Actomonas aquatica TaxID=2866162 RepID=A0ABZ1CEC2_9BACT|nr:hypothetical protein [Opitutus sp. WL0086]WRQ89899.1 hypothetical protein K1X11_010820 [Opitutus sp. WL0086]
MIPSRSIPPSPLRLLARLNQVLGTSVVLVVVAKVMALIITGPATHHPLVKSIIIQPHLASTTQLNPSAARGLPLFAGANPLMLIIALLLGSALIQVVVAGVSKLCHHSRAESAPTV